MKRLNKVVCVCVLGLLAVLADQGYAAEAKGVEAKVGEIRKWYAEIEADKSLKKLVMKSVRHSDFNPKLTRYTTSKGEVKKLEVEWGSDHQFSQETYYFHAGELIFIYAVDEYWRFVGTGKEENPDTIDVGSQQRYYFSGGTCIRALEKQAESKDPEKLRKLLSQAKNKSIEVVLGAKDYLVRASAVREIKTLKDLEAFLDKRLK